MPALQKGALGDEDGVEREVVQLVPGGDPLRELTRRIPDLAHVISADRGTAAAKPGTPQFAHAVREAATAWARRETPSPARPVIVVDQFEEAFTLCSDETNRRTFLQLLHAACTP